MNMIIRFIKYLNKHLNYQDIKFLIISIKAFLIEFLKSNQPFNIFKKRKNGISILLPTQNEEIIVKLSILSFLDFADEIIVVDNGSIDKTKEIVKKLANKYSKIKFFDKPEFTDLYQNRQFALMQAQYRWICRFDSDFVAYNEGKNNILNLRERILKLPKGIMPKTISFKYINIGGDFWHIRTYDYVLKKDFKVIGGPRVSIYEYFPFFTFYKFGKREYGSFQVFLKNIIINNIFVMHCAIKLGFDYFLRSERSNWRRTGNFKKYPTLVSYIKEIIKEKYKTNNFNEALKIFLHTEIYDKNHYVEYDPQKYLPYPLLIQEEMKKKNVFKMDKLFE